MENVLSELGNLLIISRIEQQIEKQNKQPTKPEPPKPKPVEKPKIEYVVAEQMVIF